MNNNIKNKMNKSQKQALDAKKKAINPLFKQPKRGENISRPQNMNNNFKNNPVARRGAINLEKALQKEANLEYIGAVLFPESTAPGARCPGFTNVPTAATKIEQVINLACNASGNGLLGVTMGYVPTQGVSSASVTWNNNVALTGIVAVGNNTAVDGLDVRVPTITYAGQTFPMFQKYRIVGESVEIKYIGPEINRQGYFLSCYVFDQNFSGQPAVANDTSLDRYTLFTTIRQGTWSLETTNLADNNGVRMLYIPLDPTFYTFNNLGAYLGTSSQKIVIACVGLGAGAALEVKRTFHVEWLVDAIGSQFIPVEMSQTNLNSSQQEQLHGAMPKLVNAKGSITPESTSRQGIADMIYDIAKTAGPSVFQLLKSFI